ncbi:uncharacterized protein LOC131675150 [Phymastichus coffea]|uniref:uncharacterized protein LOC131675150 n=1 Tax=Phymastichus coffea TaxID=108790 RepID=UPI00273C98EA|nr:uncharacterized protein LOC131675150 [Phymastichus coffea]XP_058809999.1 uncharacterized protein LOC131675150 [Phymastichus coffea]XP_058810000.1 uncharacterized protein LOC131675150 [Phymastichus coffea]
MAEKTPITILNEMMSKIKSNVVYEYCSNNLDSNTYVFTCKVTCDGVTALGSGQSKKEAKQNAALSMLKIINNRIVMPSTNKSSPRLTNVIVNDTNALQELKKLCNKYEFEEPVFNELDTTGPPHALIFRIQCIVSTLVENGNATTKKQAKMNAATKMIKTIENTFSLNNVLHKEQTKTLDKSRDDSNGIFKSIHKKSTDQPGKLQINYSFKAEKEKIEVQSSEDLALVLLPNLEYLQNLLKEFQKNINEKNLKILKQKFEAMLESVNIDFHHMLLQTPSPATYMLIIQLNTVPDILEMSLGATREEAELRTINKIIETLMELLK